MKKLQRCFTKLYLIHNNPIFKKIILKKYKTIMNYLADTQPVVQVGGSLNKITMKYNNEKFNWYEQEPNYWVLSDKDDYDCISVSIDPENNESSINNINADIVKCGETILTNQGSHLFKIGLKFLKKNKKLFNINNIKLKDNAVKNCNNNKRINLGIFLTLLTGDTWYGKYGFRPIDKDYYKQYKYNKKIIEQTKLNDINFNKIINKILKYKNKNKITEEQYNYFITIYSKLKDSNPLVKDLLFTIFNKEKYDSMCDVYNLIYEKIILLLRLKRNYFDIQNVYILKI